MKFSIKLKIWTVCRKREIRGWDNNYALLQWQMQWQKIFILQYGFVSLESFLHQSDLVTLDWLDISKRHKLSVLKLTFKSLNDPNFPEYLRLLMQCLRTTWDPLLLHYSVSPKNLAFFRTLPQLFSTVSQPMSETLRTMGSFAKQ